MTITLGELAAKLGLVVAKGSAAATIDGVASLKEATSTQIAPLTDDKFISQLKATKAGAIVAKPDAAQHELPEGTALLCGADPEIAFVEMLKLFHPPTPEKPGIDPRAVIEEGVELGEGVHVGPFAHIRTGTRIGARSVVMAHAVIGRGCRIGDDCHIFPHVILYDEILLGHRVAIHAGSVIGADGFGYKFRKGRHVKVPQVSRVEIGDDVEIGANTCIDRGALQPTSIGDGTKIDNLCQIGHGVRIGKHCILCGQAAIAGSSAMEDYAMLGGNVGIADHCTIGKGARVGAKSGISKDIPPGIEVWGLFAEERSVAFKQWAAVRRLPDLLVRVRELEKVIEKLQGTKE